MTESGRVSDDEVGFEVMDREHRVQVNLLDTLQDTIKTGRDAAQVVEIVDQLLDYSRAHFLSEQLLMRLHAYPEFQAHRDEHDRMIDALQAIRVEAESADDGPSVESVERLRIDLVGHIARDDGALAHYLENHGIGG